MKTRTILLLSLATLCGGGCLHRVRLATRPCTPYQAAWTAIIRKAYPRWRPPAYPTVTAPEPAAIPEPQPAPAPIPAPSRTTRSLPPAAAAPAAQGRPVEFVPVSPAPSGKSAK